MVSLNCKKKVRNEKVSKTADAKKNVVLKYITATMAIFCIATFQQRAIVMDALDSSDTFSGDSIRCAIALEDDMYSKSLETGMSYEVLREFAKADNCRMTIVPARGNAEDYLDSLRTGSIDMVVLPYKDTSISGISFSREYDGKVWALKSGKLSHIREINLWLSHFSSSEEYDRLESRFSRYYNPHTKAEKGMRTGTISPYDSLIKKYASNMGWDWRMLAAVIYQESRFSINSFSSRGAAGLMQVMPSTAEHYEVSDLLDPEQNIMAGTSHLARLQRMFRNSGISQEEQIKFVLAAYNAGEGRIADCRTFAKALSLDDTRWDEIVKAIPEMSNPETVMEHGLKFGKFNGKETVSYVDSVLSHYEAFCTICPA